MDSKVEWMAIPDGIINSPLFVMGRKELINYKGLVERDESAKRFFLLLVLLGFSASLMVGVN